MRLLYTALFCTLLLNANAQGLEESFDATCQCWKITNHYDNGQLSSIHFENKDRKWDGEAKTFNTTGDLVKKESWKNGKLHGKSYNYHANGTVYFVAEHDMGTKVGKWTFQDTDGTTIQEIEYNGNGVDGIYSYFHGGVKYFQQTIENGQMTSTNILNQDLYDIVQEEADTTGKKPQ